MKGIGLEGERRYCYHENSERETGVTLAGRGQRQWRSQLLRVPLGPVGALGLWEEGAVKGQVTDDQAVAEKQKGKRGM